MLTSKPWYDCHVTAMKPGEAADSCFLIVWFKAKWSLEACTEACMKTCMKACGVGQSGAGNPLNSSDLFITSLMPAFLPVGSCWAEWLQYPNPTSMCVTSDLCLSFLIDNWGGACVSHVTLGVMHWLIKFSRGTDGKFCTIIVAFYYFMILPLRKW